MYATRSVPASLDEPPWRNVWTFANSSRSDDFRQSWVSLEYPDEGEILKSDDSCISNPKSEISNWTVQFKISDFGFEMRELSDFEISKFSWGRLIPCRRPPES